ncbi:hypothetical protein [Pusillimonas sp. ANT_WB101]|uniref:hypothetical protein n=1 Tax=Pusillimonas sp. ANT_WB101 TaxID=2597356 RepID=UPI0011EC74AE|nr:hypothetical protein [Pusillimonas sp. ANT_WB101]KAA0910692.1 hypothetical protein FQ179_02105 [Pusillimonas sp. ANT_WB101]
MSKFNTGNPVGSTAVKDLYDNAENLDIALNDIKTKIWKDRFGEARSTWFAVDNSLSNFETYAAAALAGSGYEVAVLYQSGLNMVRPSQAISYGGEDYAPLPSQLPFTTEATFDPSRWKKISGVSGADLKSDFGLAMVGGKISAADSIFRLLSQSSEDLITPAWFDGVLDGTADDTAAINKAGAYAKSVGGSIRIENGKHVYINGPVVLDCSVVGGSWFVGPSGSIRIEIDDVDAQRVVDIEVTNLSGNEELAAVFATSSNIAERRGMVFGRLKLYGFLRGFRGQYLKVAAVEDSFAQSLNTTPGRYQEAHFSAVMTDVWVVRNSLSIGGVLAFNSAAGVTREFYDNCIALDTYDHGFYSASPSGKEFSSFASCRALNTGGDGIKCFSNGTLTVGECFVDGTGTNGIIPVADKAYISGSTFINCGQDGIYHQGKPVGAGVNTFSLLQIDNCTTSGITREAIRVSGPESLDRVVINGGSHEALGAALKLLGATMVVQSIEVNGASLRTLSSTDQVISNLEGTTGELSVVRSTLGADSTSASLIDGRQGLLRLRDVRFAAASCSRFARNRTGDIDEKGSILDGATTGGTDFLADAGAFRSRLDVAKANGLRKSVRPGLAAPSSDASVRGDIVFNDSPTVGQPTGWVCTSAGSPGTWQPFGQSGFLLPIGATPSFIGQLAVTGGQGFIATGTTSPADWKQIT